MLPSQLNVTGDSLADLLNALKVSSEELDQAGVDAIQASFREQPAVGLLRAPEEIVTAPAPPAAQWLIAQKPKFTAIAPEHAGRATVTAGPQAPTLAGPSLPPQLASFEPKNSSLRRNRKRVSTWPVSLLVATVVILGAGATLQYLTQDRDTKAASEAVPAQTIKAAPAPAPRARVVEEHPAARSVEVAGVRIVTGSNRRPQLQYVVVNHSASEIIGHEHSHCGSPGGCTGRLAPVEHIQHRCGSRSEPIEGDPYGPGSIRNSIGDAGLAFLAHRSADHTPITPPDPSRCMR